MNQIHRLGLGIAGLTAAMTLVGALVFDGYVTANQGAATSSPDAATIAPTDSPDPLVIYVKAPPTPAPAKPVKPVAPVAPIAPVAPVAPVVQSAPEITPIPPTREPEQQDHPTAVPPAATAHPTQNRGGGNGGGDD
jgi:type IV secretory pathway VirB10-like protein